MSPKIHFVYAGSPESGAIHAPLSITYNLHQFLRSKAEVRYYAWNSHDDIPLGPEDVLLGHPDYNPLTAVQRSFNRPCRAKHLIFPFHHKRFNDNLPFDRLVQQADKVFSICGPFWYDTIEKSRFAHWKPKITRLDMAIDTTAFPYVKKEFNHRRRLLYMGSSIPNKNLPFLIQIMKSMPDVTLHWYGGDSGHPLAKLKNVKTTGWVVLNKDVAERIAKECDIMISVSDSDANPTTLLEAISWGLVVACTPESGYHNDPLFTNLHLNDVSRTVKVLRDLMATPDEELRRRSITGRQEIVNKYTWERFCNTVWDGIKQYV